MTITLGETEALTAALQHQDFLNGFRKVLQSEEYEADVRLKAEANSLEPNMLVIRGYAARSAVFADMERILRGYLRRG